VGVAAEGESVRVNFPKDQVKDAPSMKANDELSQQQERQLYEHYGLEYSFVPSGSGMAEAGAPEGAAGAAAAGGAAEADQPRTAGAPGAGSEATQTGEAPGAAPDQPRTASPAARSGGDTSEAAGAGAATGAAGAGAASEGAERGSGGPASMPASGGASGQSTERAADAEGQPSEVIRLRKYIVTEHVPVQHEEVRVEREPIDEQNDAN
jgi:hypothetical protein